MNTNNSKLFLDKIKKQAKRLLQFSKNNEMKIEINNFSEAQNVLAQINGFPDWHALVTKISRDVRDEAIVVESKEEFFVLDSAENFGAFYHDDKMSSFFEIQNISLNEHYIEKLFRKLNEKLSFQWNMDLSKVYIYFKTNHQKSGFNQKESTFFKWNQALKISEENFNELFSIKIMPKDKDFYINILVEIETEKNLKNEHIAFCKNFQKETHFLNLLKINQNDLTFFMDRKNNEGNNQLNKLITIPNLKTIENHQFNFNWLIGIKEIYERKIPLQMLISVEKDELSCLKINVKEQKNEKIINGIFKSLSQKKYDRAESIDLSLAKNYSTDILNHHMYGLPVLNIQKNEIEYIGNHEGNIFVQGKPGTGKSFIMHTYLLNEVIQNSDVKFCSVEIGNTISGINTMYECLYDKKVECIQLKKDDYINPFDTELGCRFPTESHAIFLQYFLALIFKKNMYHDFSISWIQDAVNLVYENNFKYPKYYEKGINRELDVYVNNFNMNQQHLTWWSIVEHLIEKGLLREAKIAQSYASPTILDLHHILKEALPENIYGQVYINNLKLLDFVIHSIHQIAQEKKNFSQRTNIFFENENENLMINIDMNNYHQNFKHEQVVNYMLALFLNMKKMKIYQKDFSENDKKYSDLYKGSSEKKIIVLDELHRVSHDRTFCEYLKYIVRVSPLNHYKVIIGSQLIDDLNEFSELCYTKFILQPTSEELKKVFNIKNKALNHHDYKINEMIYINQNSEKIIEYKSTCDLNWCLTNISQDVILREKMIENFGFLKAIKILSKELPQGVKRVLEPESNINDFIENFINKIKKQTIKRISSHYNS